MKIADVCRWMNLFAPPVLAEDWDNTGLLCGDPDRECARVMTCLTVTPESLEEAVRERADMLIAHHPMPFRPLKSITTETTTGRLLRLLIAHDMALYCPHTAFDSAARGINQQLAEGLGLVSVLPMVPHADPTSGGGAGRFGEFPHERPLRDVLEAVRTLLELPWVQYVGDPDRAVRRVGIACGAAGEFLENARRLRCDLFLTGETNFHTLLEARARDLALVLMTHFAGERYACVRLADTLRQELTGLERVWAATETDPLRTFHPSTGAV